MHSSIKQIKIKDCTKICLGQKKSVVAFNFIQFKLFRCSSSAKNLRGIGKLLQWNFYINKCFKNIFIKKYIHENGIFVLSSGASLLHSEIQHQKISGPLCFIVLPVSVTTCISSLRSSLS